MLRQSWWKILCVVLLLYTVIAGFLGDVPAKPILHETIRNLYFHVAMWFSMMILFIVSVVYAIKYLRRPDQVFDIYSLEYAKAGIVFGSLGVLTGSEWAGFTWGAFWSNDPKQLGAVVALLIYLAYLVLRNSMTDMDKRARIGAVYNIFAFAMLFPTLWIIPRMVESLHPGGLGGNPAFENFDPRMGKIFWPAAVPGWTLLGVWISSLRIRLQLLELKKLNHA
ncbi:MAG: cytochrome c biogenesis protein [Bacteroidota bacterium]|nr:cytochrome c biogenesis protein [Bacteroidota bacterium]MDP4216965.1 cytochrome c biogenesis protein [Bacteroidota bacterium]MDP4244303.1 cytochrome c biogenesis protein [Bacteroidota bacterium]MDP4252767.1 cytochrome c biogenesis protein [Bacteroidota bacterium]MDP4257548.1 cytochrome c biogenesis protein [Bacteroidota bacterium]